MLGSRRQLVGFLKKIESTALYATRCRTFATFGQVSECGTYHVAPDGKPLYRRTFASVLPFHSPGLAPVQDSTGAYHIAPDGSAAYTRRFKRTFGFYGGFASVIDDNDGWYHINTLGDRLESEPWAWCGNFQNGRCTARRSDGTYVYIDDAGAVRTGGPYAYAGDFREGRAVVRSLVDGLCYHIDENGRRQSGAGLLELDVYHKSYARAKDTAGWFYIDRQHNDASKGKRYAMIEPFYNGQAYVITLDGERAVLSEEGSVVLRI